MGRARGWTAAGFRVTKCWDTLGPRTGFQFMENKQFRMGTSVCADISQFALKNQNI